MEGDQPGPSGGVGHTVEPGRPHGFTTFGEGIVAHDVTIRKEAAGIEEAAERIRNHLLKGSEDWKDKTILVAHFNYYCPETLKNPKYLLPSEFAMAAFSVNRGLYWTDTVHGLIIPKTTPEGLRLEAMETSKDLQVPMIGRESEALKKVPDVVIFQPDKALEVMKAWAKKHDSSFDGVDWIFVLRDHIPVAHRCLQFLKCQSPGSSDDDHGFMIVPLSVLAIVLQNLDTSENIKPFPSEGAAEKVLEHSQFAFTTELACKWHSVYQHADATDKCSLNIVQRMIYNLLGYFRVCRGQMCHAPFFRPYVKKVDVVQLHPLSMKSRRQRVSSRPR